MDLVTENSAEKSNVVERIRGIVPRQSEWKQNVNKMNRMKGEEYSGISGNRFCQKPPRQQDATCASNFCERSALRHCSEFCEPT